MMHRLKSGVGLKGRIFGLLFALLAIVGLAGLVPQGEVYADPPTQTTDILGDGCRSSLGEIGWFVCPVTGKVSEAVNWLYDRLEGFLVVNPVAAEDGAPIYEIWKYFLGITNIVFIGFLLVVIYSQISGMGISNYGIKKTLPKIIIVAVLMNLSFLICSLAVDGSNILGNGIRGLFDSVENAAVAEMPVTDEITQEQKLANLRHDAAMAGGVLFAIAGVGVAFETGAIWMLIPTILGAFVAVVVGLAAIAIRQAVVALLVMISPLAMVAYMLPNTEGLFKRWRKLLTQMLVFYPMFSLLFGASSLAGFAIAASATDGFGKLLGLAVQIFPLFFSWTLMKLSGTFIGAISSKMQGLTGGMLNGGRAWADSQRQLTRAKRMANGNTPTAKLMAFMNKRKDFREDRTQGYMNTLRARSIQYAENKKAGVEIGELPDGSKKTSRFTRDALTMELEGAKARNMAENTKHVMSQFGDYYGATERDKAFQNRISEMKLATERAMTQSQVDEDRDTTFVTSKFRKINDNREADPAAFNRYIASISGNGETDKVMDKIHAQVSKMETRQKYEAGVTGKKINFMNGHNRIDFRSFLFGYLQDGNGWAVDENGERLRDDDGNLIELVRGEALLKAPEKLVLYDKRDEYGLYFDVKDQDGKVLYRVHRGVGDDGERHDDTAFIKEMMAEFDIPIGDSSNDIYNILSGVRPGDIVTPQGRNEIGLADYKMTIKQAMGDYKGSAVWASPYFLAMVANGQIKNSAQHAIFALDSIAKTSKPGAFNQQGPDAIEYIRTILTPSNWGRVFTEEGIREAINIDNDLLYGEEWDRDENGNFILDENKHIAGYTTVENPTYEQRMNRIIRKYCIPAMEKIVPTMDILTPGTLNNQKLGTADEEFKLFEMAESDWLNNKDLPCDLTLVSQDIEAKRRDWRRMKHDKLGNPIYQYLQGDWIEPTNSTILLSQLEDLRNANSYDSPEQFKDRIQEILSRDEYAEALTLFNSKYYSSSTVSIDEMASWFEELASTLNKD